MTGNGSYCTTYRNGDFGDGLWHCFNHIRPNLRCQILTLFPPIPPKVGPLNRAQLTAVVWSLSHCLGVNNPTSGWHPVSTGYCTTWDAVETWETLQTTRIWHDTIGTNTSSIVCFLSFTTSSCHQIVIRSKGYVVVQQGPPMAAGRQTRTPWHVGGERGRTMKPGDDPCVVFDRTHRWKSCTPPLWHLFPTCRSWEIPWQTWKLPCHPPSAVRSSDSLRGRSGETSEFFTILQSFKGDNHL